MPSFFVVVRDRFDTTPADQPTWFPDLIAARQALVEGARSLICDDVLHGILDLTGSIELLDEQRRRLLVVRFDEVVLCPVPPGATRDRAADAARYAFN